MIGFIKLNFKQVTVHNQSKENNLFNILIFNYINTKKQTLTTSNVIKKISHIRIKELINT
jgi:hypothetical protein